MNGFSARPMIESALLAAVGAVLVLLGFYVPVLGVLATLLAPLASAMAVIRHDLRWGIMSSVITALALFPFLGWITAISLWTVFGLTGIFFGWAVKRGLRPSLIISVTAAAALLGILTGLLEAYIVSGITPLKLAEQMVETFKMSLELNHRIFGDNPAVDEMMKGFEDVSTFIRLLPGTLIIASLFQAYLNFEVSRWVLPKLGQRIQALPPFSRWMFPTLVSNLWLGAVLVTSFGFFGENQVLLRAAETIFHSTSIILLVQAFSLYSYYLLRAGFPKAVTGFALFLLYSVSTVSALGTVVGLSGMIDILFDFRRLRQKEESV